MATLPEMLLAPDVMPRVLADCQALVESELAGQGGLAGTAVKGAYKVVTAFAPGYYAETLRSMLPDMTAALEPFWADFLRSGGADFGDYLAKHDAEVSEALLAETDHMAAISGRAAIVKAYRLVRGGASKNLEAALPALGAMVQKYA